MPVHQQICPHLLPAAWVGVQDPHGTLQPLAAEVDPRRSSAPSVDPAAAALAPSAAGGQVVVAPDAHLDPCGVLVPLSTEDLARARTRLQPFLAKMDGLLCKTGGTCYTAHPVVLLPPELDVNPLTVRTVRELHGVAQLSRFYNRMSREQTALWLAAMEHTAPCNVDRADVNEDGFFLTEALKNPKPGRKKKPPLFGLPHALFRCTGDAALVVGHGYGADVERIAGQARTEEYADVRLRSQLRPSAPLRLVSQLATVGLARGWVTPEQLLRPGGTLLYLLAGTRLTQGLEALSRGGKSHHWNRERNLMWYMSKFLETANRTSTEAEGVPACSVAVDVTMDHLQVWKQSLERGVLVVSAKINTKKCLDRRASMAKITGRPPARFWTKSQWDAIMVRGFAIVRKHQDRVLGLYEAAKEGSEPLRTGKVSFYSYTARAAAAGDSTLWDRCRWKRYRNALLGNVAICSCGWFRCQFLAYFNHSSLQRFPVPGAGRTADPHGINQTSYYFTLKRSTGSPKWIPMHDLSFNRCASSPNSPDSSAATSVTSIQCCSRYPASTWGSMTSHDSPTLAKRPNGISHAFSSTPGSSLGSA